MSESGAGAEDGIDADKILSQAQDAIDNAEDESALESKVKPLFLGKNGELKKLLRQIGRLPRIGASCGRTRIESSARRDIAPV